MKGDTEEERISIISRNVVISSVSLLWKLEIVGVGVAVPYSYKLSATSAVCGNCVPLINEQRKHNTHDLDAIWENADVLKNEMITKMSCTVPIVLNSLQRFLLKVNHIFQLIILR